LVSRLRASELALEALALLACRAETAGQASKVVEADDLDVTSHQAVG
jgi:hypothetical protein